MKKRIVFILSAALLCLCLALTLIACGEDEQPTQEPEHTHAYGAWAVTTPATCSTAGEETRTCSCGASETQSIAATGAHSYGAWAVTTPATCGAAGVETRTCSCGASETQSIAATGAHSYGGWTVTIPALCGIAGVETHTCTCSASETRPIAALGGCAYSTSNDCDTCGITMKYTEGLEYTLNADGESYTVSKGTATDRHVVIPYYYNQKPVTAIAEYAFDSYEDLITVTIPSVVTTIGNWAFNECYNITTITIPASVTSIGENAFLCSYKLIEVYNLSSLPIKKGQSGYGDVGRNVKHIYTDASEPIKQFADSNGYIFYDDGTERYLLGYAGTDTALTLPESCNGNDYAIYKYAFHKRHDITVVNVPDGVTAVGERAFYFCKWLHTVKIGAGSRLTSIDIYAFTNCYRLTTVLIPSGMTKIGDNAFEGCHTLIEVYNLSALEIISRYSNNGFVGYYAKDIYTDATTPIKQFVDSDGYVFYESGSTRYLLGYIGTDTALILPGGCKGNAYEIYNYAFYIYDKLTSVTIPTGVTRIGGSAFFCCLSLTEVVIAASVTNFDCYAFSRSALTSVVLEDATGWQISQYKEITYANSTLVTGIDDPATAALYLSTYYGNRYWQRF